MSTQENRELVRSFFEKAFVEHDLDAAATLVAGDYRLHDPTRPNFTGGPEAFKRTQRVFEDAIAGHRLTVNEQIAEGDKVVTRWTAEGRQHADLPGIPNRGKTFKIDGITITRVHGGRIAEEWQVWDDAGLRRQLGAA